MKGDRLVIDLDGERYSLPTAEIAGIVEVERVSFLPGRAGIVEGVISLRGEPAVVVSIREVYGRPETARVPEGEPRKVVIVRSDERMIGLDVTGLMISFIWEEGHGPGSEDAGKKPGETRNNAEPATEIDWLELLDRTAGILSTEVKGVANGTDS